MNFIDCHNHSLPEIDDGAENMAMALEMLHIAQQDNISDIILTPHHLNGAFDNQTDAIRTAIDSLQTTCTKNKIQIKLHIGSEVHLTHETVEQLISGDALTYCDQGKAALIELPKHSIPLGAEKSFEALLSAGITPIIAHPERNSSIRRDLTILKKFVDIGCKSQLTAMSFTGEFGPELQKISFKMIASGYVHLIASDAHKSTTRPPILSKANTLLNSHFNQEVSSLLLHTNPYNLITGSAVKELKISKKQNRFRQFLSTFKL